MGIITRSSSLDRVQRSQVKFLSASVLEEFLCALAK